MAAKMAGLSTAIARVIGLASALLLTACAQPRGEEVSQGQIVQNRPDGLRFNQQHAQLVSRLRAPMDHGSDVQANRIDYRVWDLSFTGEDASLRQSPVNYVFERGWLGGGNGPKNPSFLTISGQHIPNGCASMAHADVTGILCQQPTDAPLISQMGARSENVTVERGQLIFGDGLDGRTTRCAVSLPDSGPDISQPMPVPPPGAANSVADGSMGSEDWPGLRFLVSYMPPDYAYVMDYAQPGLPIYRASCGGMTPAGNILPLASQIAPGGAPVTPQQLHILDMVADPGHTQPALFIAVDDADGGYVLAVLRQGRAAQIVPSLCHDCLPNIGGFFRGNPDWLLLDARLTSSAGQAEASLSLYDLAQNRAVTRRYRVADRSNWPAPHGTNR